MKNKFLINALLVSVISAIPGFIPAVRDNQIFKYAGCLISIALMFYLYRDYSISETQKDKLTIGRGAMFGLTVGLISLLLVVASAFYYGADGLLEQMKKGSEGNPQAAEMMDSWQDSTIYMMYIGFGGAAIIVVDLLIGLIVGAIFKTENEEN